MKKKLVLLMVLMFLVTLPVKANIMCRDKSKSPSCTYCHSGCCSSHGGCARDQYGNDIQYVEKKKPSPKKVTPAPKKEKKQEKQTPVSDATTSINKINDNNENDWLKYIGIAVGAGAIGYAGAKRKTKNN